MAVTREELEAELENKRIELAAIEAEIANILEMLADLDDEQPPADPPVDVNGPIGNDHMPGDLPATIAAGTSRVLSGEVFLDEIIVNEGRLVILDNTALTCRGIYNKPGGVMVTGSPGEPAKNINIYMEGDPDLAADPYQWFPGVVNAGHWVANGSPIGPDGPLYPMPDFEQKLMTSKADRRRWNRTTTDPDAWTWIAEDGRVFRAGDFNLTRGVTIHRGHTAIVHMGTYQIDNIAFKDSAGTRIAQADDTKLMSDGSIHIGRNVRGRYAFHLHHAHKAAESLITNSVSNGARKWAFVMHDSNGAEFRDLLAWNAEGAGFMFEGTTGKDCRRIRCASIGITGDMSRTDLGANANRGGADQYRMPNGDMVTDGGVLGDGFWADTVLGNNDEDCVAIGCRHAAFQDNGYWRKITAPAPAGERKKLYAKSCWLAYWATWEQGVHPQYEPRAVDIIADHVTNGIESWHNAQVSFAGSLRSDPAAARQSQWHSNGARQTVGIAMQNYEAGGHSVDMTVTGFNVGLTLPTRYDNKDLNEPRKATTVRGTFSNDVDIQGVDLRFPEDSEFADVVDIVTSDEFRPGLALSPNAPATLVLEDQQEDRHRADRTVVLNGNTHSLTALNGPVVVK